jgi:hypothetical protein
LNKPDPHPEYPIQEFPDVKEEYPPLIMTETLKKNIEASRAGMQEMLGKKTNPNEALAGATNEFFNKTTFNENTSNDIVALFKRNNFSEDEVKKIIDEYNHLNGDIDKIVLEKGTVKFFNKGNHF